MPERYRSRQTPQTHFIMKNILFILAIALASVSNAKSLNLLTSSTVCTNHQ